MKKTYHAFVKGTVMQFYAFGKCELVLELFTEA